MHAQSREALNHVAYTIAAGGSGPRFRDGAVKQPSKMPGRPNSRGSLSLNSPTGPATKKQKGKTRQGFSPPGKKKKKSGKWKVEWKGVVVVSSLWCLGW